MLSINNPAKVVNLFFIINGVGRLEKSPDQSVTYA